MKLLDHTEPVWASRCIRTNGALTYSKDLVTYQIPHWEKILGKNDIISTCAQFSNCEVTGKYNLAVQYLHSYPYYEEVGRVVRLVANLPFKTKRIIFISAYKEFADKLNDYGLEAVYIPMGIDVNYVRQFRQNKYNDNRIIYFGNIVHNKVKIYNKLRKICGLENIGLDTISNSVFNNISELSHIEALKLISTYEYGVGVGRCAQELMALGVKTIIAGVKCGGLITNTPQYIQQLETNMNGRTYTYTDDLRDAILYRRQSITLTNDIAKMNHVEIVQSNLTI